MQEKPTLEEFDLPTEEMLSADNKISSSSRQRQSGIVPNLPMAEGKVYGQTQAGKTKGGMSGSKVPLSTPSDAEYQEVTASSSLSEQETEPTITKEQRGAAYRRGNCFCCRCLTPAPKNIQNPKKETLTGFFFFVLNTFESKKVTFWLRLGN